MRIVQRIYSFLSDKDFLSKKNLEYDERRDQLRSFVEKFKITTYVINFVQEHFLDILILAIFMILFSKLVFHNFQISLLHNFFIRSLLEEKNFIFLRYRGSFIPLLKRIFQ